MDNNMIISSYQHFGLILATGWLHTKNTASSQEKASSTVISTFCGTSSIDSAEPFTVLHNIFLWTT
jgi:hypothetical protein